MTKLFLAVVLFSITVQAQNNKPGSSPYTVNSPNGLLTATVAVSGTISYSILHERDTILSPSPVSMRLSGGEVLGAAAKVANVKHKSVDSTIAGHFYKRKMISDHYNEMVLNFKDDYSLIFRAYNEGIAYRFVTDRKEAFKVEAEEAVFNFPADREAVVPYVNKEAGASYDQQFFNSFENTYTTARLSALDPKRLAFLPLVVKGAGNKKLCITEADLEAYPGMYMIHKEGTSSLQGVFAAYPGKIRQGGHNNLQGLVTERENYIANSTGKQKFPWRVLAVSGQDKELADNDLVYKLASASRLTDLSWIQPGKVAWDWWNDWNIKGVDFQSGVNNETYKHYIDFAAAHQIRYVILDEGWAVNMKADLMQVVPEINIEALVKYAGGKNVGIILWAGYYAFNRDMERVAKHYAELGVKGFKIDFMDRDDAAMVDFYYGAAATCAKYKLLADFHGAYKPTGLNRTYPNVLNFEGVHGMEQMKWSPDTVDQVTYDVTIPFIRMLAGPMDYTQGAMRNAIQKNYYPAWSDPMSQGTRCRQLAEYVVFEAPLNMLCDNPSNYKQEPECTGFIASVPEVWDQSIALDGQIGGYVVMARKKGADWYIGAISNWQGRDLDLDLSFLDNGGAYIAEVFRDGANADKNATDYRHETIAIPPGKKIRIKLAPGGGYTARIYKK